MERNSVMGGRRPERGQGLSTVLPTQLLCLLQGEEDSSGYRTRWPPQTLSLYHLVTVVACHQWYLQRPCQSHLPAHQLPPTPTWHQTLMQGLLPAPSHPVSSSFGCMFLNLLFPAGHELAPSIHLHLLLRASCPAKVDELKTTRSRIFCGPADGEVPPVIPDVNL